MSELLPIVYDVTAFGLQALIVVIAVALIVALIFRLSGRRRGGQARGRLMLRRLDDQLRHAGRQIRDAGLRGKARKSADKAFRKQEKALAGGKSDQSEQRRIFVLDFEGDMQARRVAALREEVSAIVAGADKGDEVLLRLSSGGGTVVGYGLGASQLARLRDAGVRLTVAVDKIAASGGYMMACVADRVIAAPFAMVGSIGVVAVMPNLRRLLNEHGVEVEQLTSGRYKRTLSLLGENTDEGRAHFQQDLDSIHNQFKEHVSRYRPDADLDAVGTGEHWTAQRAVELGLVDAIQTSDAWLMQHAEQTAVIGVKWRAPVSLGKRLRLGAEDTAVAVMDRLLGRSTVISS